MASAAVIVWTAVVAAFHPFQVAAPSAPPVPSALILGRVVDAASGRPLPGAIVTLDGGMVLPGSGPSSPRAMTNANGQFVFRKLPPGNFMLTATKNGYVDGAYGRRKPGGTHLQLPLEQGQRVGDVVIRMWRQASIAGTIIDEAGEPLIAVQVRAFQRRYMAGRRRITQAASAATDDRGVYRFSQLAPGEYLIGFVAREASIPLSTAELLRQPATPTDPKLAELSREQIQMGVSLGSPGTLNTVPSGDMLRHVDPSAPVPPAIADGVAVHIYPTQFFPGVGSASRAAVIALSAGQHREDVDFSLRPVRASRVSGTVIGRDGPVANIALRLVPLGEEALTDIEAAVTMAGQDGSFTFLGVPPGQYAIKALRTPRPETPRPTMTTIQIGQSSMISMNTQTGGAPPPPVPDDPTMFAHLPVAVGAEDVSDVVVPLHSGARVTGRVEFEGARERPDAAALQRIPITPEEASGTRLGGGFTTVPSGRVADAGTFKTYGLPAGRYLLRVGSAPSGWYLKSVISEGRDISETPIELGAAEVSNVVITFTDRPTRLTGSAKTPEGNPDSDALVVVFPADASAWTDFGLNPRRIRSVRASQKGTFAFTGLPAGDYYVAAIREEAYAQWQTPEVLGELSRVAFQVRLVEGDTRTQDLKTAGGGR